MPDHYSLDQLKEFGKQIFLDNPHMSRVYVTEDANFFGERGKSDADNYARETQQELIMIDRIGPNQIATTIAESDDPMTQEVVSLMMILTCTEDKARELIKEHKGNAAAAIKSATDTINAVQQPDPEPAKAPAAKRTRKPSTPKKTENGTA